jgi:hypothetical protein
MYTAEKQEKVSNLLLLLLLTCLLTYLLTAIEFHSVAVVLTLVQTVVNRWQ